MEVHSSIWCPDEDEGPVCALEDNEIPMDGNCPEAASS